MRQAYRVLALLIAVAVVVQASAIAYQWFQALHDVDANGLVITSDYEGNAGHTVHEIVGTWVIPLLVTALLIVSFFAHVTRGVRTAVVLFVMVLVQVALAFMAFGAPILGVLHGLVALGIFGMAVDAARRVPRDVDDTVGAARA